MWKIREVVQHSGSDPRKYLWGSRKVKKGRGCVLQPAASGANRADLTGFEGDWVEHTSELSQLRDQEAGVFIHQLLIYQ